MVYHEGKFYPFDSPSRWVTFPGFSWLDVVRFGAVGAYFKALPNGVALEKYTADAWLQRWLGWRAYNAIWRPMLVGKFGEEYYKDINMAWLWARIKSRTTRLGTFQGGFQAFLDLLAERVRAQGATIVLDAPIAQLTSNADGTVTVAAPGGPLVVDHCIATSSPRLMARLAPELPDDYSAQLRGLKSLGAVVMVIALTPAPHRLLLAQPAEGSRLPVPGPGRAHQLHAARALRRRPHPLLRRLPRPRPRVLPALEGRAARALPAVADALQPAVRPQLGEAALAVEHRLRPARPAVNHSRNIPAIKTPVAGLYFASMSQVYPWDRGTNYAVEIGRRVAKMVMGKE